MLNSKKNKRVELLGQVMKDFEKMQVTEVGRQRKKCKEIEWTCRL